MEKFLQDWEEKTLNPKIKKEIDDVRQVIYETTLDFHNYVFPKYINNYKKYLWFVAERIGSIDPWQSNINYPMVSAAVDTMFSNVFDFGYQFGINEEAIKQQCIKAFDFRGVGKNTFKEVAKETLITGKSYAKDYFLKETLEEKFFGRTIKTEIKLPSMQYISVFDVMYDRSKWLENSAYKIVRTFATGQQIKGKVLPLLLAEHTPELRGAIEKKFDKMLKDYEKSFSSRFSMYDYNPVKALTAVTQWMNSDTDADAYFNVGQCSKKEQLLGAYAVDSSMNEDQKNYFLNTKDKTYELVEYTTDTDKYIFANGNIIYFGKKKFNLSEIREVTFSIIPWTGNASGIADKLTGLQDLQNTLWNAFIDNIKLNLWPMFKISGNIQTGKTGKLDFKSFRAFKTNGGADIEKVQLGVSDFAPLNFMQMVEAAGLKESGMNNYVTGGGGSIERTAQGVDLKFNQYKSKLTPLTDSIDQMMGNIARSWVMMFLKFFSKEELAKKNILIEESFITDEEWVEKFDTILINGVDIKTIIDENNINFTYNSLDKVTKENSRDTIIMNFQYLAQYAGSRLNYDTVAQVFSGKDFDWLKLFVSKEEAAQAQAIQQQQYQQYNQQPQQYWQEQQPEWEVYMDDEQLPWEMSDDQLMQELTANI